MNDKNINQIKEYAKQQSIEDTILMILSNRTDFGGEVGGLVSVKQFGQVAKDLIEIFPQLRAIPLVKPAAHHEKRIRKCIAELENLLEDMSLEL